MSHKYQPSSSEILIPRDLDAGTAPEIHETLLDRLSADGETLRIDLKGDGDVWPLALQLIASAARSVPEDRIAFGPDAQAALQTLATSKKETS